MKSLLGARHVFRDELAVSPPGPPQKKTNTTMKNLPFESFEDVFLHFLLKIRGFSRDRHVSFREGNIYKQRNLQPAAPQLTPNVHLAKGDTSPQMGKTLRRRVV